MESKIKNVKKIIKNEIFKSSLKEHRKFNLLSKINELFKSMDDKAGIESSSYKAERSIINSIYDANMILNVKFKILKLIDYLYRDQIGAIFLSNEELENNDLLRRSM